jgi:Na+-driven multidrug efflux pump
LSTVFNQGVSQASSIIVGNTLGEGDRKKTYQRGRTLIRLSLAAGIFAGIVVLVLSPPIVRFFNVTQETVRVAGQLSYSVAIMVVFQALQSVLTKGVLRGGGDTLFLVVADVVFLWLASIPLGYLAGLVLKVPPFWVYMALKIDYILKTLLCLYRFKTKKWIRRVTASQPILPD